jgi:hypothetical protein
LVSEGDEMVGEHLDHALDAAGIEFGQDLKNLHRREPDGAAERLKPAARPDAGVDFFMAAMSRPGEPGGATPAVFRTPPGGVDANLDFRATNFPFDIRPAFRQ